MYIYFAFSAIFNTIVSILLGFFILFKNTKSEINRSFFYFCVAVAFWSIFYIGWPLSKTASETLFWFRLLHIGACFTPITYFHFVVNWLGVYRQKKIIVYFGYFLAAFFSLFVFSHYFIAGMIPKFAMRFWAEPGILYHFYLLYFFGFAILSSVLLYLSCIKISGIKKYQIKCILLGMALSFIGGSTNYFLWYNINIPPYGNILGSCFVVFSAYAIVRYRFMDIRIVARKSFIYFGLAFFSFFSFFLTINYFKDFLNDSNQISIYLILISFSVVFTACFYFIERMLKKIANKYFFAGLYNYQETIKRVAQELTNYNDLKKIINLIVDTIKKTIQPNRISFLLVQKFHRSFIFKVAKVVGFNKKDSLALVKDNFLVEYFRKIKKPLAVSELIFLAKKSLKIAEKSGLENLYGNMIDVEASLCLPLVNENTLVGIIVLGEKINGSLYANEDLELLSTLANQAGIAVNNALLYKRVNDFNKSLQRKVDEQTMELKNKAKELQRKNKNLNKLLEVKNEFLRMVNHQLNTPVSVIKNSIFMIKSKSFSLEKGLDYIEKEVDSMENIFNEFWKAFSFESESLKHDLQKINIEEILNRVIDSIKQFSEVKDKKLSIVVEKNIAIPKIKSDVNQITHVLNNLLENAVSYTSTGGIKIYFENLNNKFLKIFIKDTGCGIDKKDQKKLFEKFSRGRRAIQAHPTGSGLGLYIAKRIVESGGGKLELEKTVAGKGTIFSVTLPIWK